MVATRTAFKIPDPVLIAFQKGADDVNKWHFQACRLGLVDA